MSNETIIDGKKASRRHIIIFDDDHNFIQTFYGDSIGYSAAIRAILHEHVKTLKKIAAEKANTKLSKEETQSRELIEKIITERLAERPM